MKNIIVTIFNLFVVTYFFITQILSARSIFSKPDSTSASSCNPPLRSSTKEIIVLEDMMNSSARIEQTIDKKELMSRKGERAIRQDFTLFYRDEETTDGNDGCTTTTTSVAVKNNNVEVSPSMSTRRRSPYPSLPSHSKEDNNPTTKTVPS